VETDRYRYQTIYARNEGSVAAPTAGLHFTEDILKKLQEKNIRSATVTLHVGAGTFLPVKTETIADHPMHTEEFAVTPGTLEILLKHNGPLVVRYHNRQNPGKPLLLGAKLITTGVCGT
jgi:S-adenosylmethionine:tRNA ribosyltransferase-isomerase